MRPRLRVGAGGRLQLQLRPCLRAARLMQAGEHRFRAPAPAFLAKQTIQHGLQIVHAHRFTSI
jgi:hypothetical protein